MTEPAFSCPFCNTTLPAPVGVPPGQRVVCPRCEEGFPYRGPLLEGPAASAAAAPAVPPTPGPGWSNRVLGLSVLGVMFVMAGIGLAWALATVAFRRGNDVIQPPEERPVPVRTVAPSDLAGLGYLPAATDVIVAVHVAEALQDPAGRAFLRGIRTGEFGNRNRPGEIDFHMANLEQWTGLSLDEIDHAVLALGVQGRVLPRSVLVVQTRRRYDPEAVRTALKAGRTPEPGEKKAFAFPVEKLPLKPVVWFAGERTLVVGGFLDDLDAVPATPAEGPSRLAPELQTMVKERIGPVAQMWVVGHAADWDKTGGKVLLALLPEKDRKVLEKVRTFGGWLQFGQGLTAAAACRCADAQAAEALGRYFQLPAGAERKPFDRLGDRREIRPLAEELAARYKVDQSGEWVTVQARAGEETVNRALAPAKP